jgi:ubiquinone/menaquinone biosynthesis C-methylase UbiE
MSVSPAEFDAWLATKPTTAGFIQISQERSYAFEETDYDHQYNTLDDYPPEGIGLCRVLQRHMVDLGGPALEVGCGTGKLTSGMALECPWPYMIATDPSPAFLRITSKRLASLGRPADKLRYAILRGDDLNLLPAESVSLVSLRSTLHHILDVDAFIDNCERCLRPGGALAMGAEPCVEGYVLMGAMAQFIPAVLANAGITLTQRQQEQLQTFVFTMNFYCRQDIDKTQAEDKHLFHPHELALLCARHGLEFHFYPNVSFDGFANGEQPSPPENYFSEFFLSYLRYCMSFDPEFVVLIGQHIRPYMAYVESCYAGRGNSPYITGVFLAQKRR